MSRWFRFYDDVINDPKVLSLSESMRWSWVAVLCIASKHDGNLPSLDHVALHLRVPKQKAAATLAGLHSAGLLDKTETGFTPHNWNGRQYKSDVSTERVKRFRQQKRNVSLAVSETPPETEDRNREQKDSEADASGAEAPLDPSVPEREYFIRGRQVLGPKSGAMIANLLKAKGRNVAMARAALEQASQKQNPTEYIAAICRGTPAAKPLTAHQQEREKGREILNALRDASSRTNPEFQRHDTRDGPASLRGGVRGALVDLSATRDREGHEPVERTSRDGQLSQSGKVS